jgi:hypothetical protein
METIICLILVIHDILNAESRIFFSNNAQPIQQLNKSAQSLLAHLIADVVKRMGFIVYNAYVNFKLQLCLFDLFIALLGF